MIAVGVGASRGCPAVELEALVDGGLEAAGLRAAGLEAEATMIQASRLAPLAGGHRLAAINPVVVAVGRRL